MAERGVVARSPYPGPITGGHKHATSLRERKSSDRDSRLTLVLQRRAARRCQSSPSFWLNQYGPDLDGELATTRRMLERVPDGKEDWRPHKKSRSLGELATHIAQLPGFGILMLTQDEYDGAQGLPQPKAADKAARLKMFDEVSAKLRSLLQEMTWDHSAHHRAQLGMYLRVLDVSVPTSYGSTADEGLPPA